MNKHIGTSLRAIVLISFLLNTVVTTPASAAPSPAQAAHAAENTPVPDNPITTGNDVSATATETISDSVSSSATATDLVPATLSPTPEDSATPEATASLTPEATGTPIPTDTPAATATAVASAPPTQAANGYSLSLGSSPAFLPRGGTLSLT